MADTTNTPSSPSPQAAPASAAPSNPAPAQAATPAAPAKAPTTMAERAMNEINSGTAPKRKTFEEISAEMNGTVAQPSAQPNSAGAPAGDGTQAGTGLPPQAGQPPSEPQAPAGQTQLSPEQIRLQAGIEARDELLRQFAQQMQPAATPAAPATPAVDDLQTIHNYQVPEQFLQGLRSEDPAQASQALNAYTGMVARTIHRAVRVDMEKKMTALIQQTLPKMVQQFYEHNTQTKAVYEDFYNNNKDLNKPELYPTIVNIALGMANDQKAGYTKWDQRFRDDLATRVRQVLGIHAQQNAPARPAQPALMTPSARPGMAAPTPQDAITNEIMALKGV